jgi:hypothetical protein
MTPAEQKAWEAGRDAAADLAWSDEEERPWEYWGEDKNARTAQIVAKEIAKAIRALTPPPATPSSMPPLAEVITHYGIDALCRALAPEIVREATATEWTPPEDRPDGFECLAWLEGNRLQTMGVGGWEKVRWETSILRPPGYWWCPHGGEQVSPTAFAPLPEGKP